MVDMQDKAVVITGASRGIGAAAARAFASAGAGVVLAARTLPAIEALVGEITRAGGRARAVACDVSRYSDVDSAVRACLSAFGRLDVMVNNAGVIEPIGLLSTSDPRAWGHAADINFKGTYHGIRAALEPMQKAGRGVIINVSSGAASSPLEGWSQYCAAKAAALMLTRCADREAPAGIRVVGLSPGTVDTDMQVAIRKSGINPVSRLDRSAHIPPEWVGKALVWLASDDAAGLHGEDVSLRDEAIRRRIGLSD